MLDLPSTKCNDQCKIRQLETCLKGNACVLS
jgi:hypothetical protein